MVFRVDTGVVLPSGSSLKPHGDGKMWITFVPTPERVSVDGEVSTREQLAQTVEVTSYTDRRTGKVSWWLTKSVDLVAPREGVLPTGPWTWTARLWVTGPFRWTRTFAFVAVDGGSSSVERLPHANNFAGYQSALIGMSIGGGGTGGVSMSAVAARFTEKTEFNPVKDEVELLKKNRQNIVILRDGETIPEGSPAGTIVIREATSQ